jgi:AbrB family transcriptional regulator, transcriptional pleiotropic regulator of transition state genes
MKSTGITRPVDPLGRVVIPMELRRSLGIVAGEDTLEIFTDGNNIVLRKYQVGCIFCGETETVDKMGKRICQNCLKDLRK